jgi:hypothetical protein
MYKFPAFFFSCRVQTLKKQTADQKINSVPDAGQQKNEAENQQSDDELEFSITFLVGR